MDCEVEENLLLCGDLIIQERSGYFSKVKYYVFTNFSDTSSYLFTYFIYNIITYLIIYFSEQIMEPLCPYYELFLVLIILEIKNQSRNYEKQLYSHYNVQNNSKLHFIMFISVKSPCHVTIFCSSFSICYKPEYTFY